MYIAGWAHKRAASLAPVSVGSRQVAVAPFAPAPASPAKRGSSSPTQLQPTYSGGAKLASPALPTIVPCAVPQQAQPSAPLDPKTFIRVRYLRKDKNYKVRMC